jgi:pyruvate/2-oxoglutarate dehydrogenase complex dihydrolipoamide acyltransferase (E2) component
MESTYTYQGIPTSRIATFDMFTIGLSKHHIVALIEFDVTESRKKVGDLKRSGLNVSFNGWLLSVIGKVLGQHPEASAFIHNKQKLIIFKDINISMVVEKKINDKKVPIPLVIERANEKSAGEISGEIQLAKDKPLSGEDIVLHKSAKRYERIYYHLPGFLRRAIWRFMLRHPKVAFRTMGNVSVTSVGMMGKINGWFIHKSVHPISFGIGSVIPKAVVKDGAIVIRDMLNMTILVDHDVIDGGPMVRLLNDLTRAIEEGDELEIEPGETKGLRTGRV